MASGLAVVASGVGEVNHVIDNGVDGFIAHEQDEFTKHMTNLSLNRDLFKTVGAKAATKVRKSYSLDNAGKKLNGYLNQYL